MEARQRVRLALGAIRKAIICPFVVGWAGIKFLCVWIWGLDWRLMDPANFLRFQILLNAMLIGTSAVTIGLLYYEWGFMFKPGKKVGTWSFGWVMAIAWVGGIYGLLAVSLMQGVFWVGRLPPVILKLFVAQDMVLLILGLVSVAITVEFSRHLDFGNTRVEMVGSARGLFKGEKRLEYARVMLSMEVVKMAVLLLHAISNSIMRVRIIKEGYLLESLAPKFAAHPAKPCGNQEAGPQPVLAQGSELPHTEIPARPNRSSCCEETRYKDSTPLGRQF